MTVVIIPTARQERDRRTPTVVAVLERIADELVAVRREVAGLRAERRTGEPAESEKDER